MSLLGALWRQYKGGYRTLSLLVRSAMCFHQLFVIS